MASVRPSSAATGKVAALQSVFVEVRWHRSTILAAMDAATKRRLSERASGARRHARRRAARQARSLSRSCSHVEHRDQPDVAMTEPSRGRRAALPRQPRRRAAGSRDVRDADRRRRGRRLSRRGARDRACPSCAVTCVDSIRKKVAFLQTLRREVAPNLEPVCARETRRIDRTFDAAVSARPGIRPSGSRIGARLVRRGPADRHAGRRAARA